MSNPPRARTHLVTETGYLTADGSQPRCPESTAQQQQCNLYAAATWSISSWRFGGCGRFIQPTTNATDVETATRSTVLTNSVGIAAGKQSLLGAEEADGEPGDPDHARQALRGRDARARGAEAGELRRRPVPLHHLQGNPPSPTLTLTLTLGP